MSRNWKPWTPADVARLRAEFPHRPSAALAADLQRPVHCVCAKARSLGLHKSPEYLKSAACGRIQKGERRSPGTQFKKGLIPWTAGRKGYQAGGRSAETRFAKGHKPHNWVPVGTYRVNPEGYLDRKVGEARPWYRSWVAVHRLVWIEANGPIPPGHVVTFKSGRHSTELEQITPDALELITQQESMRRNTIHNLPAELVDVIHMRAGLVRRIRTKERKRAEQNQRPA